MSLSHSRVVITGLGAVTPLGLDREALWQGLLAGRSGIAPLTLFDVSRHDVRFGGEVKGFDPARWIDPKEAKRLDRCTQIGLVAADEAFKDSGLKVGPENRDRIGCILGLGIGGIAEMEEQQRKNLEKGPRASPPSSSRR